MAKDDPLYKTKLKCKHCGKTETYQWMKETNDEMARREACFECNFWFDKLELTKRGYHTVPGDLVRVEGVHYVIGQSRPAGTPFLGHGGRKFKIRFNDGREEMTNNLWCQGTIPEHFRKQLPDNATFITEGM
jgi:hypothetical protein